MAEDGGAARALVRGVLGRGEVENFRQAPRDWTVWLNGPAGDGRPGYQLDDKMNNGGKWPPGRFVIPRDDFSPEVIFLLMSLHINGPVDPFAVYQDL